MSRSRLLIASLLVGIVGIGAGGAVAWSRIQRAVADVERKLVERGVTLAPPAFDWNGVRIESAAFSRSSIKAKASNIRVSLRDVARAVLSDAPLAIRIAAVEIDASIEGARAELERAPREGDVSNASGWPGISLEIDHAALRIDGTPAPDFEQIELRLADGALSGRSRIGDDLKLDGVLSRRDGRWIAAAHFDAAHPRTLTHGDFRVALDAGSRVEIRVDDLNWEGRPFSVEAGVSKIGVAHPSFSTEPWPIDRAHVSAHGSYDRGKQALALASEVQLDELGAKVALTLDGPWEKSHVKGAVDVPTTPCTALNAPLAHRSSVRAEGGELRLAAAFELETDRAADFRWEAREKTFTCILAPVQDSLRIEFLRGAFVLRRTRADGSTTDTSVEAATAMPVTDALRLALTASEDSGFAWHKGVDPSAIEGAMRLNLEGRTLHSGASTITMQLARTLYLTPQRTLGRKLDEAMIALYLEQALDKRRIMELYLSIVPFGPRLYGVRAAARFFFKREHDELSLKEAVALMQLLPSPARRTRSLCNRGRLGVNDDRVPGLLQFMFDHGWIDADALATELARGLEFRIRPEDCPSGIDEVPIVAVEQRKA